MTRKRFREEVEKTADEARAAGQKIEVHHKLGTIFIDCNNGDEFFFQGEEAYKMIDQCPKDLSVEDWLLWQAQGW